MSNQNPLTNGSYWGPVGETPQEVQLEKLFLASGYLTGMAFGMQLILYFACMRILWKESRTRYSYFLMLYTSALCATNVILTVTAYIGVEAAFIDNQNFPGGIINFIGLSATLSFNVISVTMLVVGSFLADALLLWRCRVIWMAYAPEKAYANVAMILPGLLVLASLALGITWDVLSAAPNGFFATFVAKIGLAYFSVTFVSNMVLTCMIVYRLWGYQNIVRQSLGREHGGHYTSITTMFIESAALFSISSLLVLGSFAANSDLNQIFLGIEPGIQLMSSYFIIWRVAEGKAWSRETITPTTGSLRFTKPRSGISGVSSNGMTFTSNATATVGDTASSREVTIPLQDIRGKQSWSKNDSATDFQLSSDTETIQKL